MTIPPSGDKIKVVVIGLGIPSPRDEWMLEKLRQHYGMELAVDYKHLEDRAAMVAAKLKQSDLYGRMFIDDLYEKPTKHEVGTYAAMFGQPAKTYTPPHKQRKGKRK